MKRSEINALVRDAAAFFRANGWTLPPNPRWDVTDFGLGDWRKSGLVLVNLADEPEYCEKLMYARRHMLTPCHCHRKKKEDIIARAGAFAVRAWPGLPSETEGQSFQLNVNGVPRDVAAGEEFAIHAGERLTMTPGLYHEFWPISSECMLGEVSTANDDVNDNFFTDPDIGRFPDIDEDEPALLRLISDDTEPAPS